jgi:hypothetical protein
VTVTGRGPAEEAVVVVKPKACEDMVTYLRVKLSASSTHHRVLEAKGGTCNCDSKISFGTTAMSSADQE